MAPPPKNAFRPLRKLTNKNIVVESEDGDGISVLSAGGHSVHGEKVDNPVRVTTYNYNSDSENGSDPGDCFVADDATDAEDGYTELERKKKKILFWSTVVALGGCATTAYFVWTRRPNDNEVPAPASGKDQAILSDMSDQFDVVHERPFQDIYEDLTFHCPSRKVLKTPDTINSCLALCLQATCCVLGETNLTKTTTDNSTQKLYPSNSTCLRGNETLCNLMYKSCSELFPASFSWSTDEFLSNVGNNTGAVNHTNSQNFTNDHSGVVNNKVCAFDFRATRVEMEPVDSNHHIRHRFLPLGDEESKKHRPGEYERVPDLIAGQVNASYLGNHMVCHPNKLKCQSNNDCISKINGVLYSECVEQCSAEPPSPVSFCAGIVHASNVHSPEHVLPTLNGQEEHKGKDHLMCHPNSKQCITDLDCQGHVLDGVEFTRCSTVCEPWKS